MSSKRFLYPNWLLAAVLGAALGVTGLNLPANAACTNPSPLPSGFAAPCPVWSVSAASVPQSGSLTLSATPQAGTDYILTTAYISQGTAWNPYALQGNNAVPSYSSALASLTLSSTQLTALSLGTHYAVSWDWLWDATAQCYKGPGLNQCNTGQWRVQSFVITSTYAYSQSSYYAYSQSAYYAYSQSAYSSGSTPFTGTPAPIPGTVQIENFDNGGEGVAYHDADATNNGGQYRTTEGVDIESTTDTGGGYDIGWAFAGEWMNYTVSVGTAGTYTLGARVSSNGQGGTFHITMDGATIGNSFTVPNTGGWQNWTTLSQSVSLTSGTHILKLVEDTNGTNGAGSVANFNYLQFTPGSAYSLSITKSGAGSGTITSSPAGINCGTTCSANYTSGTAVTLTATPASGSVFTGWSGACSGTGTCTVTMNAAQTVTAAFNASGLATDCTLYVSPSGGGTGLSAGSPETLAQANSTATGGAVAGSVVCLEGGTYNLAGTFLPARSGTASQWITWKAYGDSPPFIVWTGGGGGSDHAMFHFYGTFPTGTNYLKFIGLNLNGQNFAGSEFFCQGSHHIQLINNTVRNGISSGLEDQNCDYFVATGNFVAFNGENPNNISTYGTSCSSGISLNYLSQFDSYSGIHNIIANNVVGGSFCHTTQHSDGNGIILDNSTNATSPATLIVNNVVYGNGGRGIMVNDNDGNRITNSFVINNTTYDNGLDLTMISPPANFDALGNGAAYWVNNLSAAWSGRSGTLNSYQQENSPIGQVYVKDMWNLGAGQNFTYSDPSQFIHTDPKFVNPPVYNSTAGLQYLPCGSSNCTIDPANLGTALQLQSTSPAINAGIDPSTIAGLDANIVTDLRTWIYKDINGVARPQGSAFDLGAYEY